jgi:YcxB-like protein
MTIQTDITRQDFVAFRKYVAFPGRTAGMTFTERRKYFAMKPFGWRLMVAVVMAAVCFGLYLLPPPRNLVLGIMIGLAAMSVIVIVVARWQIRRLAPAEDGFVLGPKQVEICDEGIRQNSRHHESLFRWSLVSGAVITSQYVFVMLDRAAAVIVPRRAFKSEAEGAQFISEVNQRAVKKMA